VDKKNFVGLPIPPAAGLIASIVHFAPMPLNSYGAGFAQFYAILMMVLIAVLGVLMVSTLKYSSFKTAGAGRRNLYLVLVVAAGGMLIFLYSKYVLLILSSVYVAHGVVWYVMSLLRRRPAEKENTAEV
jgi:CDP-diacylglycerol--serine O-phosphatidyltransferase